MNITEQNIAFRALERLQVLTSVRGEYRPLPGTIDGEINFYFQDTILHTFVELKKELKPYDIPGILEQARDYPRLMVVAERIYPAQKMALKEKGIAYLDLAGNIYLEQNGVLLWLEGNRPPEPGKPATNRAFTKTGLKSVFYFLMNEKILNLPYRDLAHLAGTALGNVKYIIEGLDETGFILPVNKKKKVLQNKKALLERWITGYQEILKPALYLGDFNFWDAQKFQIWNGLLDENEDTVWGGEPAADLLTNYLQPGVLTLYTNEERAKLVNKWTLIPAKNGQLKMYRKFWTHTEWDSKKLTPPLLVYADLMITDDPRCIETAGIIYEKFLKDEFDDR